MFKQIATILLLVFSFTLTSCVSPTSGLKSYIDTADGYQFLYPNGWTSVNVANGPDVVFRDLIEQTENVSVIVSPVTSNKTLAELGTPSEVGYRLSKSAIAPPDSGREAELVNAEARKAGTKDYYILEYAVKFPNQLRHNLASVVISRGKLFTINISATEARWQKAKELFEKVVKSFSVY